MGMIIDSITVEDIFMIKPWKYIHDKTLAE